MKQQKSHKLIAYAFVAIAVCFSCKANAQNTNQGEVLIRDFVAKQGFVVDSRRKGLPLSIRCLVNRAFKKKFNQGPMLFVGSFPWTSTTRKMQICMSRAGEYVILYRHGATGFHEHIVYVNKKDKLVHFMYYNSAKTEPAEFLEVLGRPDANGRNVLMPSNQEG